MSFLWYWPAGGWDFDLWKRRQTWEPIRSDQSGHAEPIPLISPGATRADWEAAAKTWRSVSDQVLGTLTDKPPAEVRFEWLGPTWRTDKYTLRRLRYSLTDDEWGYAWLCQPHEPRYDRAAVIAHHQTVVDGKHEPVALNVIPEEQAGVYYAHELAERGFTVLAPDAIAFGERQGGHRNAKYRSSDDFFTAHPHGSVMFKMAFDGSRAVDLLEQLPEVQAKKIASLGHSHGGYGTLFSMVTDPRITAGVISCGIAFLRDDPRPERWWRRTALIPRLGYYADDIVSAPIDFHHWIALCAPRPLFITAGTQDAIFPNQANIQKHLTHVRDVYALYNAEDALQSDIFEGTHSFRPEAKERAYDMLAKTLS